MLQGTLQRLNNNGVDSFGDPVTTTANFVVEGFHDNFDTRYASQAGIPITDSKLTLILGNCQTDPVKDDVITLPGYKPFKVRSVKTDPAKASAECQVFQVGNGV